MGDFEEIAWPFPVPPAEELPEYQRRIVEFLDVALEDGFAPTVLGGFACYAAKSPEGRTADIIRRGGSGKRWEVVLSDVGKPRACSGFVTAFEVAAQLALLWLRGEEDETVWASLAVLATRRWRHDVFIDAAP